MAVIRLRLQPPGSTASGTIRTVDPLHRRIGRVTWQAARDWHQDRVDKPLFDAPTETNEADIRKIAPSDAFY